jgi:hypothetical protein
LAEGPRVPEHKKPLSELGAAPTSASAKEQNLIAELWQRRILSPDSNRWTKDDEQLLERLRSAENAGAIQLLRRTYGGLKGWAVSYRKFDEKKAKLRLTKEGFEKYLFLRSQQAVKYFDKKEIGAKQIFALRDIEGRTLFTSNGLLTEAGQTLFDRIASGVDARWKDESGQVYGSKPVRPAKP